ncbi:MAG TPA: SdrD B-like domain-containing protein [Candidatus Dormibacteraeota bacterium]|nr:SdrD B-like domain-containing protein [Candidatus Dormibacteraeota bacterium]
MTKLAALQAAALLVSTSAWANFGGTIYCDANCNGSFDAGDAVLGGVTVQAYACGSSTVVGSTITAANGTYSFEPSATMPLGSFYYICVVVPTGYTAGLNPGNPGYACSTNCFTFANPCDCTHDIGICPISGSCAPPPPPPCTNCVDAALGLGAAAGTSVLELGASQVSITGPPGGILGDIGIAPNGKLSITGSEYVTGTIKLGAGATFANSSSGAIGGVQNNVDLSAQINAAYAANASNASLPCTQTFTTLNGSIPVITGGHGVNVICVKDISLSGKQILLTGPSDAKFVFNITGKLVLTGGGLGPQIRVDASAGIATSAVLYNLIGTGADVAFSGGGGGVSCCAAIVDGTILAPYRKIALSPGLVNGEVISGLNISIVSGSSVRCPPCP